MKMFIALYLFLLSVVFAATKVSHSPTPATLKIKFCLASIYSAEVSNYLESKSYSDDTYTLGLGSFCESINPSIILDGKNKFTAQGEIEDQVWTINERKELKEL